MSEEDVQNIRIVIRRHTDKRMKPQKGYMVSVVRDPHELVITEERVSDITSVVETVEHFLNEMEQQKE